MPSPYHKNPRKISERQLSDLERWLDELGDLSGIVHDLNTDEIIGGNQRSAVFNLVQREIVLTEQLPLPDRQGTIAHGYILWQGAKYAYRQVRWTAEQCQRANIIANKAGGEWELDILLKEFDTAVLLQSGFDQEELDSLLAELEATAGAGNGRETADAEPQTNRAEELRQEWQTETGQLWVLPSRDGKGEHRLIVGDCTDREVVERVMSGDCAEMIWTDPPYGVAVGDKNKFLNSIARSNRIEENLENDTLDEPVLADMLAKSFALAASVCLAGGAWYVAAPPGPLHVLFGQILKDTGIWRQTIQWVKNNATFAPLGVDYHWQTEPIFYGWLPGAGHRYYGGRTQTTVWEIDRPLKSPEHPTMKPVELVQRAVANSSRAGEIVYDPFSGSGTTLIACENLGRYGRAIEISPAYCAVILQRYYDAFQIRPYLAP